MDLGGLVCLDIQKNRPMIFSLFNKNLMNFCFFFQIKSLKIKNKVLNKIEFLKTKGIDNVLIEK